MTPTIENRFWSRVDPERDPARCWEWKGAKNVYGYGKITNRGRDDKAHRVSWELAHGKELEHGVHVLHRCDNPGCVNPGHLFAGSHRDNMLDRSKKERHPMRRFTGDDVRRMRAMRAEGKKLREIGAIYNARANVICAICTKRTWKHIE